MVLATPRHGRSLDLYSTKAREWSRHRSKTGVITVASLHGTCHWILLLSLVLILGPRGHPRRVYMHAKSEFNQNVYTATKP